MDLTGGNPFREEDLPLRRLIYFDALNWIRSWRDAQIAALSWQLEGKSQVPDIRSLAPEIRTTNLYFHIEPCFEDPNRCYAVFGSELEETHRELTDPTRSSSTADFTDHLLVDLSLEWCCKNNVPTLAQQLAEPSEGSVVCSIEKLMGDERIYENEEVQLPLVLPYNSDLRVQVQLQPQHILGETGWLLLSRESELAVVGVIRRVHDGLVNVDPLIIGSPTFEHSRNSDNPAAELLTWYALSVYETLPEDIDEFAALASVERCESGEWTNRLQSMSRQELLSTLREVAPDANWSGDEQFVTGSIHVGGRPLTAAIWFTDDSPFQMLTRDQLGERGERLRTLSCRTADLLVVLHRHEIDQAVREAIRSFATAPHAPRRYCLLDGPTLYRLRQARQK